MSAWSVQSTDGKLVTKTPFFFASREPHPLTIHRGDEGLTSGIIIARSWDVLSDPASRCTYKYMRTREHGTSGTSPYQPPGLY